jgi:hypothetical protein
VLKVTQKNIFPILQKLKKNKDLFLAVRNCLSFPDFSDARENVGLRLPSSGGTICVQCGGSGPLQVQLQGQQPQAEGHGQRLSGSLATSGSTATN